MSNSSPARRIRRGSIRIGLIAATISFVLIEGDALQDQLTIGQSSVKFMLGTALLSAGICVGLFGLIAAIGLVASVFFNEWPAKQSPKPSSIIGPVGYESTPRIYLASNQIRHGDHPFSRRARSGALTPDRIHYRSISISTGQRPAINSSSAKSRKPRLPRSR
jgi:hypothetical protein